MVELEGGFIVAITLASALVLLLLVFLATSLLVIRKKRLFCFRRDHEDGPFRLPDKNELQGGWKRKKLPFEQKHKHKRKKKAKGGNKSKHYQSLSRLPKFPSSDPFANKFLENPMVDMDDFNMDWTNPAFDKEGAQIRDAATTIQSWYRMIRYRFTQQKLYFHQSTGISCFTSIFSSCRVRVPFIELKESTILVQALFRGQKARAMLPKFKREKAARDVRRC